MPTSTAYELELFAEKPVFKVFKPTQESNNKLYMGYEGNIKNLKVTAKKGTENIPIKMTKYPEKDKDSVQLFFPKMELDSLEITVENGSFTKSFTSKLKNLKESDSLKIANKTQGALSFRDLFTLSSSTPIKTIDNSKIILRNKDSVSVNFTSSYDDFNQEIKFDFKKEEEQKYTLEILPEAFTDFYETKNDSLKFEVNTKLISDYGNLKVNLSGVKRYPLILEILDDNGAVFYSKIANNKETLMVFETIEPKQYTLRVIYDDNANGFWDTGDFLAKKQAEEIIYYPKKIDVRANWDVEQDFGLE